MFLNFFSQVDGLYFIFKVFTCLEFDDGVSGNDDVFFWFIRIAANAAFAALAFKYAEVTEFDIAAFDEGIGDGIQDVLNDSVDLV